MEASSSDSAIELYLPRGCCAGDSYAQTAHDQSLLFTLSNASGWSGSKHVLRDANSVPLYHSRHKSMSFKTRIDVYKGDFGSEDSLAFTIKGSSFFSSDWHIFLVGTSLDGPPDYKLKTATFGSSLKIFQEDVVIAKAKQDFVLCGCSNPDYIITTFPGIDQAMVVLLVTLFDDLRQTSNGGGGATTSATATAGATC